MHWKVEFGRVWSWMSAPAGEQFEEVAIADWLFAKRACCSEFKFLAGPRRPRAPGLCGHFLIADLHAQVTGAKPVDNEKALQLSAVAIASFRLSLPELCRAPALIGGALGPLLEQSLAAVLVEKGACEGDIAARAQSIIGRLGQVSVPVRTHLPRLRRGNSSNHLPISLHRVRSSSCQASCKSKLRPEVRTLPKATGSPERKERR